MQIEDALIIPVREFEHNFESSRSVGGLLIQDERELHFFEAFLDQNKLTELFIDIETTGLDPFSGDVILVTVMGRGNAFLIHLIRMDVVSRLHVSNILHRVLENPSIVKVFHNGKFDLKFIKHQVLSGRKTLIQNLFDTYLAERILRAGFSAKDGYSLGALARKYLNHDLKKDEQTTFTEADFTQAQIEYAVNDVKVLEPIYKRQIEELKKSDLLGVAALEFSILPAVADIELAGMMIDLSKLQSLKIECEKDQCTKLSELRRWVETPEEVNFNSPVQVKRILAGIGLDVINTRISTISRIDHPFAKALMEYRKNTKLLTSFVNCLPACINQRTGRIHPEFFQLGTATGRFTCQKPNLQQIPRDQDWRSLFVAREGYLILTADYNQIELRILAEYSQDEALLEAFRNGEDLHKQTAAVIFEIPLEQVSKDQRDIAKKINFGLYYGMTSGGLAETLFIDVERAERFINNYFRAYPGVKETLTRLGLKALMEHCSKTMLGRKRFYADPNDYGIERKGRNTPIQGTCGDIIKKALQYLMVDLMPYDAEIINLIHDELVIEVKEDHVDRVRNIVKHSMVRAGTDLLKSVPVTVETSVAKVWRK